jgi:gliding motility-associated-like protein
MKKFALILLISCFGIISYSQITAPSSSTSFSTNYTSGYLSNGGENDPVYVFCSNQSNNNIGQLTVAASGCSVNWFRFDGFTYSAIGQTGSTASGLISGLYMAQVNCGGSVSCHRAWVWVNQTFVDINPIEPGCESFTLTGQAAVLDNQFVINDPPGLNFEIDANTYIQVCFWATHTYVSDLGFYLKAPGNQFTEPNNDGVVALLPAASDWGTNGTHQSNTTIPWTVTGCSPADENVPCNDGNHIEEFCFTTNIFYGGPALNPANPAHVPCVCDMETPLNGMFAPAESWSRIYGQMAGDAGWAVQIYDCEPIDFGVLTAARLVFRKETACGATTFLYDSGTISSNINDNSCSAATASVYVVPPSEPAGTYTVTSSITNYSWSCSGSAFTGNQLSHQIVKGTADFPVTTSDFTLTVTETINAPGNPTCQAVATETFFTMPADATINPPGPVCANTTPFQLQAADGGGIWTTNAPAGSIVNNIFYPGIAGGGTWTVNYNIGGPCPDDDQITITIYETVEVVNFSDNVCDGADENYTVSFDVINNQGNPANFMADYGSGFGNYTGSFSRVYPSQTPYSITVVDVNNCSEYILSGVRDCGCTTFAGNLSSTVPLHLCQDQCTDMLSHSGQILDDNDMREFIVHDGGNPMTILAYNPTNPHFCLNNITNGQTGQVYFIAAIAGNVAGSHVSLSDPCFSQSISTPVIWHANPLAHIAQSEISVCGLTAELSANTPNAGHIGTWTANGDFTPLGGQTVNSPQLTVLKTPPHGDLTFTWTVVNNNCSSSDDILVHFYEQPNAYAGEDVVVCGNEAELTAVLSLPTSTGSWSGNGSFSPASSPETTVTGTGNQVYTWRETNGICNDDDYISVSFIPLPQPTTTPNVDTVCGIVYNLSVYNVNGTGYWAAYENGVLISPAPYYEQGISSPNTTVFVTYTGLFRDVDFVWTETLQAGGLECTNTATKRVRFARQPVASVGAIDEAEICGNCFTFNADTVGSGWATGYWIAKDISGEWQTLSSLPNAEYCINPLGSFGDSAHVEVPFLWVMSNSGCTSIDTMTVTFFKRPQANAGLYNSICGNDYTLGAVYNLPANASYTPSGLWSVFERPNQLASATFDPTNNDTVDVTVSHYGIWSFRFRENNSLMPSCFSTDTVHIEFVERPIISAGIDKDVCGQCTQLEATSAGFPGSWLPTPGINFDNPNDPNTGICSAAYDARTFTWLESSQATLTTLSCSSTDDVVITFWRVPTANIMTDIADSTVCGLTFPRLRAENPGTGITGYWFTQNPSTDFSPSEFTWNNASATVPNYGYHNFYWIEETGPDMVSGFCTDTAGPLRIHFIEIPNANAGGDTLFCGYSGNLNAITSVGTGVWSTPSVTNITFGNLNNPNTLVTSSVLNADNPTNPYFLLIWTEDNTNGCTDKDTIKVTFARIPTANMQIIPPKCFGESATIKAVEDTLGQYTWNFYSGVINSSSPPNAQGGVFRNFVSWNDNAESHLVSLITTNSWNCQSPIRVDTVYEPPIPDFDVTLVGDTCLIGKGGIIFGDTLQNNSFFWLNEDVGPPYGSPITAVYNIPEGSYYIRTSYQTLNMTHYSYYLSTFGNANCVDTLLYEIEPIGVIDASFEISADVILEDLTAPEAPVIFLNYSDYDDVRKRCEWHFGDGNVLKNCDDLVEHTYTEAGCFTPFLIVMNRDLPECRDTAFLDACIRIDNQSSLEIPNIFSPNADGVNDYFQVKATTLRTFSGTIVNRWGKVVYTWDNWKDLDAGWDGKLSGGTKASPGVYYFIIKAEGLDGQPYEEHGALHLMNE